MNIRFLCMTALALTVMCGSAFAEPKVPMFFNLFGPMEWNEDHWEGQNFKPLIRDHQFTLPAAQDNSRTLFAETSSMSSDAFIQNLKRANIITGVYNERRRFRGETGNVIVELGRHFYTLSDTDQDMIAQLISRSFERQTYLLKDFHTKKIVGTITPQGLNLY